MSDENVTLVEPTQTIPAEGPPEPKKTRQMSFTVLDNGEIRADFGEGVDPLVMNPLTLPEALQAAAVTEGVISRLRGYTSKLVDDARTPEALRAAVNKGMENLRNGVWKIERAPGEGTPEYSIEVEAAYLFRQMRYATRVEAAQKKGEPIPADDTGTIAEAAEQFAKLTDEQKKELKALTRYQLALAEVKAKRNAAKQAALQAKIAKEDAEAAPF